MINMNRNGFTLVELIAAIAILIILTGVAIGAYSQYKYSAIRKGIDTLMSSSLSASENYFLDHVSENQVTLQVLEAQGYLENRQDPNQTNKKCTGTINKTTTISNQTGKLNVDNYRVSITCLSGTYCKKYPGGINC